MKVCKEQSSWFCSGPYCKTCLFGVLDSSNNSKIIIDEEEEYRLSDAQH